MMSKGWLYLQWGDDMNVYRRFYGSAHLLVKSFG